MPKRAKTSKLITIGGIAAIGAVVTVMFLLLFADRRNAEARRSLDDTALATIDLTKEYQAEEGKWRQKQYDNSTMVQVIDKFDLRYQALLDRANGLDVTDRYQPAKEYLVKSIESEKQSNLHLRNYIVSGSQDEYEKSVDLFSLSLQYSADYDAAIGSAQ